MEHYLIDKSTYQKDYGIGEGELLIFDIEGNLAFAGHPMIETDLEESLHRLIKGEKLDYFLRQDEKVATWSEIAAVSQEVSNFKATFSCQEDTKEMKECLLVLQ